MMAMRDFSILVPVMIAADGGSYSHRFEHNIALKVRARTQDDALKRLTDMMSVLLDQTKEGDLRGSIQTQDR